MKQSKIRFRGLILILSILLSFHAWSQNKPVTASKTSDSVELVTFSKAVLKTIRSADYAGLSRYIHPTSGIRFSPYGFVNVKTDQVFSRSKFQTALQSQKKIAWGTADGTGDPIVLTLKNYFKKFVYDVDFLTLNTIGVNRFIGRGNSLNNLQEIYRNASFVEFHSKGTNKRYEGMDWRSVRLVLSRYKGKLYVIGVVHDQWTT